MTETKYPLPEIKYLPGDTACFISGKQIIMARVRCTFYDTKDRKYKFLLDRFAREFTEDDLFDSFYDANNFMDKEKEDKNA